MLVRDSRWFVFRVVLGFLGAVAFVGCFRGEFYAGQRCRSNDDCGPRLTCVQGYCGGGAVGSGGGSSDGAALASSTGTEPEPVCGNSIVEADEFCDDAGESATCNDDCTFVSCGDGVVNQTAGEDCEGKELQGATCESQGLYGGQLSCSEGCSYDDSGCFDAPGVPVLGLSFSPIKQFDFSWAPVLGAQSYQLLESSAPGEPFDPIGEEEIVGESISITTPLHFRYEASYRLRACNGFGCTDSAPVDVVGSLVEAIGYFKASNAGSNAYFGRRIALSGDGRTLAVAATGESSGAAGIDGDQTDVSTPEAGAVYVFVRDRDDTWSQQAYIKSSSPDERDYFGESIALSDDGHTLAVGAYWEGSNATGIDGDPADNSAPYCGAVYVFVRGGNDTWSQQAYVKASNADGGDWFGRSVALSDNGHTLAVGAPRESSNATGIGGDQTYNSSWHFGAVYVFVRDRSDTWSQQSYIKASNAGENDNFGMSVTLSDSGNTLAVGATGEDSNATGIDGDQLDGSAYDSGAVYVFIRDGSDVWSQQAYIKASNTGSYDVFGVSVALNGDGNTLAVGANREDSGTGGIDGDQIDDSEPEAGAVYVFIRGGDDVWSQQAYIKASNTGSYDNFGVSTTLSDDGNTLAVGAGDGSPVYYGSIANFSESSGAKGIGGDQSDDSEPHAGAVYVFVHDGNGTWSQQAYVKASNTDEGDRFGSSVALSDDGSTLAVGAYWESSEASSIGGIQNNDSKEASGAVYLY